MALPATQIYEVNQAGASTNGGGFDPANSNMATNLAATLATSTAPVVTSASYNFDNTRDAGKYLFVQSGTNWSPGWYPITSCAGNAATLNASIGAVILYGGATTYNTVAGCATTASPTAGKWSVDYSQGTAAGIAYTDMVIDGTTNTKYTSAGNAVGPNVIGNCISVNSGTGFTVQRVQVVSVVTTTATCDKSLGTLSSTGGNGSLGGAVDHPATIGGIVIAGNVAFVKYSATAYLFGSSANASGGRVSTNFAGELAFQGYDITRTLDNTDANRPICRINANSVTAFTLQSGSARLCGFVVDNPGAFTTAAAVSFSGNATLASRVKASAMTSGSFQTGGGATRWVDCEDTGSNTSTTRFALSIGSAVRCVVQGASGSGAAFSSASLGAICEGCVAVNHPATAFSFGTASSNTLLRHCVAYNTTGAGFLVAADTDCEWCVAYGSSTNGFSLVAAQTTARLRNCAGGSNATNVQSTFRADLVTGFQALTGDPFANAGSLNFGLNNTVGAGAACRGLSATLPGLSTTSYPDAGAAQTQATAGIAPFRIFTGY